MAGAGAACGFIAIVRRAEEDGVGGAILLTLVSTAFLAAILYGVEAAPDVSIRTRVYAVVLGSALMSLGFALALATLAPGAPVVSMAAERVGVTAALPPAVTGQPVTLRARADVRSGARGNIDFAVAVGDVIVAGSIARLEGHVRIGRRRAKAESQSAFHERLHLPAAARDIRVTNLAGPLQGAVRFDLLPVPVPIWAGLVVAVMGTLATLALRRRFKSSLYVMSIAAGLGALAAVVGWGRPAAPLEHVAGLMVAGALLGGAFAALCRRNRHHSPASREERSQRHRR